MSDQSLSDLVARLSNSDGLVRERARHALALVGSPAVPLLLELATSRAKRPRWEAAKALAEIADPSSIATLVQLLSDSESDIRWIGAEGLVKIGPRSLPNVLELLMDKPDSIDVRRSVHHVLHELAVANPLAEEVLGPVLKTLGETDPTSSIPPRAEHALKRIQSIRSGDLSQW
jgi:HEAT repeat protein